MAAVPAFILLSLIFWSFGDRLSRILRFEGLEAPARFAFSSALSLGFLTLLIFLLAVLRIVTPMSCAGVVLAMALVSLRELRDNSRSLIAGIRQIRWRRVVLPRGGWQDWALWLSGLVILLAAVQALAPMTGMDTGRMHFAAPKFMMREHGLPDRPETWFHRTGGYYLIYLFGLTLQGEALAKLLAFAAAPLILLLAAACAELRKPGTGRIAAAAVALTPLFSGFAGYEYLELPVILYLLAALYAYLRYDQDERPAWAAAAGLLAGFSMGVKISTFPVLVILPMMVLRAFRAGGRRSWSALAAGGGLFIVSAGFWPLWNWWTTGSWVYSYLEAPPPDSPLANAEAQWTSGIVSSLVSLVTTSEYWMDSCGPYLIAALAGVLFFRAPASARLPALLVLAAVGFYFTVLAIRLRLYFLIDAHSRYLGPCFLAFGALAAASFHDWAQSGPRWLRIALAAALLVPAAPLLLLKAGKAAVAAPAAFGIESRSHYLGKKIETFAACEILNALPDRGVKVLFIAQRPYYLDRPIAPEQFWDGLRNREDFARRVRDSDVTHVVFEPEYAFQSWMRDPDQVFSGPLFRELARWPWKKHRSVRLYAVDRR